MRLYQLYATQNECYQAGRTITPAGIMVHSTGANNPNLKRYVGPDDGRLGKNQYNNHWNTPRPGGQQICCHAFIGKLADGSVASYQILPWTMRGWHCGKGASGSGNDSHIGFEICEDGLDDKAYFEAVYREAVELCAALCEKFGLSADSVIDHAEGCKKGIASNHGDIAHWLKRHGLTMNDFRAAVKKALAAPADAPRTPQANGAAIAKLDRVRVHMDAKAYYPGGKQIPLWVKLCCYTAEDLGAVGGVPCAKLREINTWCALNQLSKA
ncbi:MAG: peptidoglycan recognition protein family protein [Oscillospiraceae bacterium]|nr:peptidoglycan recognition protein family protein [Oscillospiraceae bacterium]